MENYEVNGKTFPVLEVIRDAQGHQIPVGEPAEVRREGCRTAGGAGGARVMTYTDMTTQERESLDVFERVEKAGQTTYLAIVALLCAALCTDGPKTLDMGQYTRGDLKRAIKVLRIAQRDNHEFAGSFEGAVQFIRRTWLHREVTV